MAPPVKKQKFQYKKKHYQTSRKQYLEVGQKGFLATCNFNEKDCVRECYNILNEYATELYGPEIETEVPVAIDKESEQPQHESEDTAETNDDIADELEKQINATKEKSKDKFFKRRFQVVDTGATNCVFIKTTLDDPITIARHIIKDIAEIKKQKTRYLLRLVPIDAVCKANNKDIVNAAGLLCDKYFLKESTTFSIIYNKRFNNDLNRDELIRELADLIHAKNINNKVDLKHAKRSLIVEVIKGLCCLTVVEDYLAMKKYNLVEVARANQEYDKQDNKMNDEKQEKQTVDIATNKEKIDEKESVQEVDDKSTKNEITKDTTLTETVEDVNKN